MDALAESGVIAGTHEEFADFFREHYEEVLRAMYLVTGDRFEAEEVAQSAFVKVYERWDRVAGMKNPAGYAYRAAVNAHRSRLRRIGLATRRTLSLQQTDEISKSDDRDRIRRLLSELPESQREVVALVAWLGFSDVAWSPDGTRLVLAIPKTEGHPYGIYVIDSDGEHLRFLGKGQGPVAWRPGA
jgi:RNA polymerase sigma factor (sigma-70 family)